MPRSLHAIGLCCLILGACADTPRNQRALYVVRSQDTLYSIAWRYSLDFKDLARWNHIGPDFRILVGQTLTLSGAAAPPARAQARTPANAPLQRGAPSAIKWAWPTDRLSAPRPVPGQGILLSGHLGQDIRAASAGRVVYTGAGIRGYEILIIIKHGENLLSAYAHNSDSLVRDGEEVAMGQLIAHMGNGAPQTPVLYFEIRRNGKPVDPIALLPDIK